MKRICVLLAVLLTLAMLCGCGGYINSYAATVLITSCHGDEAGMEFASFRGTYHLRLRSDGAAGRTIDCDASLDEGEIDLYIGTDGEKEFLRTVKGGEICKETIALDDRYENEDTVYIILESEGKCKGGDFLFRYN